MMALPVPLTSKALPVAPLSAPPPNPIVPFNPTRLTFFAPPVDVSPLSEMLTGAATPVRSRPAPVVFIVIVLMVSVPTLAPRIAVPLQFPILKPESVLLPGAPASVTPLPAPLVVVGVGAATVNNVIALTIKLTP